MYKCNQIVLFIFFAPQKNFGKRKGPNSRRQHSLSPNPAYRSVCDYTQVVPLVLDAHRINKKIKN